MLLPKLSNFHALSTIQENTDNRYKGMCIMYVHSFQTKTLNKCTKSTYKKENTTRQSLVSGVQSSVIDYR